MNKICGESFSLHIAQEYTELKRLFIKYKEEGYNEEPDSYNLIFSVYNLD